MRRAVLLALATTAAVAVPVSSAMAIAPGITQKYQASFSPSKAGTKKKPKAGTLKVRPFFDVAAEGPAIQANPFYTDVAKVYFPKESTFEGKNFPQCARAVIQSDEKKCPKGSQVGTGKAAGFALGILENLTVKVFNGKRTGSNVGQIELLVVGASPLVIRDVISGPIKKVNGSVPGLTGSFGLELAVDVPPGLQEPAPGAIATLTDFDTTVKGKVKKKGKTISIVNSIGCAKGKWDFGYIGSYNDGTKQSATVSQKCTK